MPVPTVSAPGPLPMLGRARRRRTARRRAIPRASTPGDASKRGPWPSTDTLLTRDLPALPPPLFARLKYQPLWLVRAILSLTAWPFLVRVGWR